MTIKKIVEGETVWSRKSNSGRTAIEAAARHAERLECLGWFVQTCSGTTKDGRRWVGVIVGTDDNCMRFVP